MTFLYIHSKINLEKDSWVICKRKGSVSMKKLMITGITVFALYVLAIALSTANDMVRAAPGMPDHWRIADVDLKAWTTPLAAGEEIEFTVDAKNLFADYTIVTIEAANVKIETEDGIEVCNKLDTYGTCENIINGGGKTKYIVKVPYDRNLAGFIVKSAYYY